MLFRLLVLVIQLKKTFTQKLMKLKKNKKTNTDYDHGKCITAQEFNKLMADNFADRLK